MSFLAPWALAIGAFASLGVVLLHLVARQRPAAYMFPTTRFVPDRRTLVSRAATRPSDLVLLAVRVLLLMAAAAAFARPVLTPKRGAVARITLTDRSRSVAAASGLDVSRLDSVTSTEPLVMIAFDSMPETGNPAALKGDFTTRRPGAKGSLTAALVAARRASVALADRADSVQLILESPLMASEFDAATARARAEWPGAIRITRTAAAADTSGSWQLERALPVSDPLGPTTVGLAGPARTRLLRAPVMAADSAFARDGETVVRWDSTSAKHATPEGLAANDDVIVAALERTPLPAGTAIARWADGAPAAVESAIGRGCIRTVGIALPGAGDLALHPPFQRIARSLLAPCGVAPRDHPADSSLVKMLAGNSPSAAAGAALRVTETRPSPLAPWLLAFALLLAFAELGVRVRASRVAA